MSNDAWPNGTIQRPHQRSIQRNWLLKFHNIRRSAPCRTLEKQLYLPALLIHLRYLSRLSTSFQLGLQPPISLQRVGQHFSRPFANASFLNAPNRSPSGAFFPLRIVRVDAAQPRLGRVLRTAPVSRQTKPNPVCHSPRFHSHPVTLTSLRSVPFTVPSVFVR